MSRVISISIIVGTLVALASPGWATQSGLAASDWSANSRHNLAVDSPPDKAVMALVNRLNGQHDLLFCSPPRFVNLRNSGNLSLVVSTNSGTVCGVQIIDKTSSGFELYDVDGSAAETKNLGGTGISELVATADLTFYEGANHCQATWPVIYAWTGNGYSDVSSHYKEYYGHRLEALTKQIAALSLASEQAQAAAASEPPSALPATTPHLKAGYIGTARALPIGEATSAQQEERFAAAIPTAMPDVANLDCLKAEAAKIERFLGTSKDAGMNDAIQWANSDDLWTRVFASDVLFDIDTTDALAYLRTLSNDANPIVATEAKGHLEVVGQPTQHTVDLVSPAELPSK